MRLLASADSTAASRIVKQTDVASRVVKQTEVPAPDRPS